jgi:hypothetical protein
VYTSPDEARSDLFLSGGFYIFSDVILGFLLRVIPLDRIPGVGIVITLALPLVSTVLVPFLLIRYRKERIADFGWDRSTGALALGAVIALPIVALSVAAAAAHGPGTGLGMPAVDVALGGSWLLALARLVQTVGLVLLGVYCAVKARDAFRSEPQYLPRAYRDIAKILAIIAAVTTVLLALSTMTTGGNLLTLLDVVLPPLGVAAAAWLAYRRLSGSQLTTRAVLLTPVILFAVGRGLFSLDARGFVQGLWRGAMYAGLGLIVGALLESRRSALGPIGLALVVGLLTYL